jgi:hypothetical protein
MFFSEEQWVKDGDRYSILQYIIGDIFIDGLPDAGTTATLVEGMDRTVFEYSSKILEGNDLVNKHKELFYKFFAVMTAINL